MSFESVSQSDADAVSGRSTTLGRRLLTYVVLVSLLLTLASTTLQVVIDYRRDVAAIDARIAEIERTTMPSLARSLWNLDAAQLRLQLQGLSQLPDIQGVEVLETDHQVTDPLRVTLGELSPQADLRWSLPIRYGFENRDAQIGVLRIEASLKGVRERLLARATTTLLGQGVVIFVLAVLILVLVDRLVTRHLVALAQALSRYDVRDPSTRFVLRRRIDGGRDELDQVAAALGSLQGKLEGAYSELSETNAALERDVVARRRAEAAAAHLAHHDPLTDLPNRRLLFERLQHELSVSSRSGSVGALLFIDIDHFKTLNDARGHSLGDALLIEAARRISSVLRDVDLVARLGGDEFVAVLASLGSSAETAARDAHVVAEKLRRALGTPLELENEQFRLTCSIGVALFPTDGADIETLLKHADSAMYHAKTDGRNTVRFFQPALYAALEARHTLEQELRGALEHDGLSLAFQPLVRPDGTMTGAECLVRWRHAQRGWVSPAEFIPVCEESGLIISVSDWVIRTAIAQLRRWGDAGLFPRDNYLAVNISPRQFAQGDFVDKLVTQCREAGVRPSQLVLEITEGVVLGDMDKTIARMNELRGHGFRFYIDDFGSGYSSMAYLKRLPVDGLKIDQSFVRELHSDANDAAIVEAILAIGHRFSMIVVAEGVETADQAEFLRERHCDAFQGYFFGRPELAPDFEARLRRG